MKDVALGENIRAVITDAEGNVAHQRDARVPPQISSARAIAHPRSIARSKRIFRAQKIVLASLVTVPPARSVLFAGRDVPAAIRPTFRSRRFMFHEGAKK